jgi:heme/copper-type cytochrome/quinol oxidase subunit 2
VIGVRGFVISTIIFAVGAILDWAATEPQQYGFNVNKVGWMLMIVGIVGVVLSIIVTVAANTRRRRTVVHDGQGHVVHRVDSTYWVQAVSEPGGGFVNKEVVRCY